MNTTDSRVELMADLSELRGDDGAAERVRTRLGDSLRLVVTTERSQLRNRELALERLATRLDDAARVTRRRRATRPTKAAVEERLQAKRLQSQRKAMRTGRGEVD